jgi:WD40 repeat protein
VSARFALLLLLPAPALAEPGPPPHEYRTDRHGYPLPPGAVARLGVPPPLSGFAWAVGWTADGARFAVVDWAGVTVFDAATGRWLESQTVGTEGRNLYTPLSRDGRFLFLLAGRSGVLYDVATTAARPFTLPEPFADPDRKVYSLTLSADGRFLAGVAGPSAMPGVAWRYDLARDKFARLIPDRADLHSVRLSPDGRRVYATTGPHDPDLTARTAAGKELWTVSRKQIGTLRAVSADGRRLAVADGDGLTVHDAADGKLILTAPVDSSTPPGMWGIDLSPDGSRLAIAIDREVTVWDVPAGKVRHRLRHPAARLVAFGPDGRSLLTVSAWVQRWDVETGKPMYPAPVLDKPITPSHLRWSLDGRRLLTVWPGDRRGDEREWRPDLLAVWDVRTMTLVWRQTSTSAVVEAHLDPAGTTVRAVTRDDKLRIWPLNAPADPTVVELKPSPAIVSESVFEFFPDGRLVVQHHGAAQVTGDVYDPAGRPRSRAAVVSPQADDWRRGRTQVVPMKTQPGVVLYSDGRRADLTTGRPCPPLEPWNQFVPMGVPTVGGSALVASSVRWLGAGSALVPDGLVWDLLTGRFVAVVNSSVSDWSSAALSPDGRWLATLGPAGVELRNLSRRDGPKDVSRLPASGAKLLAFAPDAKSLATAQEDGSVLVWTLPTRARADWDPASADRLWANLSAADAADAWPTLWHLLDHPAETTEFLKSRLKAVPVLTDTLDQIAKLDHPRYPVREAATRELVSRGALVEGDLRTALQHTKSAEQQERLETLLSKLDPTVPPSGEALRGLRAVWLSERLATPEARRLLETVAGGASGSRVTIEAKVALERLAVTR